VKLKVKVKVKVKGGKGWHGYLQIINKTQLEGHLLSRLCGPTEYMVIKLVRYLPHHPSMEENNAAMTDVANTAGEVCT
jgi:hypothetical protein